MMRDTPAVFLLQLFIFLCIDCFQPFIGSALCRHLNSQMGEPTARCRPMPMLHFWRDIDHISRFQLLCRFSPFLIVSPPGSAEQNLTALMVDMPVVPAARFKGDIGNTDALCGQHFQIALANKILGVGIIRIGCPEANKHETLIYRIMLR